MGKGQVRITNELIKEALKFPIDWEIEGIRISNNPGESIMLISGQDFPDKPTDIGAEIPFVTIKVTKENITFEVKRHD